MNDNIWLSAKYESDSPFRKKKQTKTIGARVSKELYSKIQKLEGNNTEIVRRALENYVNRQLTQNKVIHREITIPQSENCMLCLKLSFDKDDL